MMRNELPEDTTVYGGNADGVVEIVDLGSLSISVELLLLLYYLGTW